jgi:membrane-associated phospholipid phosphatase
MRSLVLWVIVMAFATAIIGFSVRQMAYFPGDVGVTRWVQAQSPGTAWADTVSRLATSPFKYFVMGLTIGLAFALGGWRGALLAMGVMAIEQYGAESTKAIFMRPRPSPTLVRVVGTPTGYSFPSTTMTLFAATFGVLAVLSARTKSSSYRWPLLAVSVLLILAGSIARVAMGAHWPSDVILTAAISLGWIWVAAKALL